VTIKLVLLPGFQKGRDIKSSKGKGQGAVWAKKGQFASYKEKWTEFHSFLGSTKCFPLKTDLRHSRWLPDGAGITYYQ
jgi:hypothetical protein